MMETCGRQNQVDCILLDTDELLGCLKMMVAMVDVFVVAMTSIRQFVVLYIHPGVVIFWIS